MDWVTLKFRTFDLRHWLIRMATVNKRGKRLQTLKSWTSLKERTKRHNVTKKTSLGFERHDCISDKVSRGLLLENSIFCQTLLGILILIWLAIILISVFIDPLIWRPIDNGERPPTPKCLLLLHSFTDVIKYRNKSTWDVRYLGHVLLTINKSIKKCFSMRSQKCRNDVFCQVCFMVEILSRIS